MGFSLLDQEAETTGLALVGTICLVTNLESAPNAVADVDLCTGCCDASAGIG